MIQSPRTEYNATSPEARLWNLTTLTMPDLPQSGNIPHKLVSSLKEKENDVLEAAMGNRNNEAVLAFHSHMKKTAPDASGTFKFDGALPHKLISSLKKEENDVLKDATGNRNTETVLAFTR